MFQPDELVAFVACTDLDRAADFYGAVLGLPLRDERPYALSALVNGAHLRITAVEAVPAAEYTVLGFTVGDVEAAIDELSSRGVEFTRFEGMDQDGRGAWRSPNGASVAWFSDPDGNRLSITQLPA